MKALNLTMNAFGPYVNKVVIDFSKLENKLFLITGPTGSGKTTILDGISFALFCRSTGARRFFLDMRNASVSEKEATYVSFDFDLNNERYRFHREFRWVKNRKTGELKLKEEHSCFRYNFEEATWDLLESGSESKIRNKAQEILGLNSEQFSQVIVLPQGEFRKLLLSNSNDKLKIFQILFKTERFEKITKVAMDLSSNIKKQCEINLSNYEMVLKQEKVGSLEQLKENYKLRQNEYELLNKRIEELKSKISHMNSIFAEKQKLYDLFDRFDALSSEIIKLDRKKSDIESLSYKLSFLQSIKDIFPSYNNYKSIKTELDKSNFKDIYENLKKFYDELLTAEKQQVEKETLKAQYTKCVSDVSSLESAIEKVSQINQLDGDIKTIEINLDEVISLNKQAADILSELKKQDENLFSELEQLREVILILSEYKIKFDDLNNKIKSFSRLNDLKNEVDSQQSNLNDINNEIIEVQNKLSEMEQIQKINIAASLALNLNSNDPCPVCGSTHHPKLAECYEDNEYESEISNYEKELSEVKLKFAEQNASLKLKNQLLLEQHEICLQLKTNQDNINLEMEKIEKEIIEILKNLNIKYSVNLLEGDKYFDNLSQQIKTIEEEKKLEKSKISSETDEITSLVSSHTETIRLYELDLKVKQAAKDTLISQLPDELKEYNSEKELINQLNGLKNQAYKLETNIKTIEENFILAQNNFNINNEKLKLALKNYFNTIKSFYLAIEELKEKLKKHNIKLDEISLSDKKFEKLDENIDSIKEEISKYNLEKELVLNEYNNLEAKLDGQTKPELSTLSEEISLLEKELNSKLQNLGKLSSELNNCKSSLDMLENISEEGRKLSDKYSKSSKIANLLNGSNPYKVPFKIFALGLMLKDILNSSNIYFSNLTQNRYSFKHKSVEASGRGFSGLDIEVFDAHFGSCRAVETLSGGEMFLASLALSFGLSDVVQNYSGGVHIDSIFIDEGFGSLDEETLNTALKALLMVQKSGRTIGIISHVEELKTFIENKIQITKLTDGQSNLKLIGS